MPIPLSRSPIDDEIKAAVLAAIDSRQYILGPECTAFEQEFARYLGSRHAVLTSSATAALWMALKALGVKHDSEILVPSHTAFPTVEAICFTGATPVFVEVDDSYTVELEDAERKTSPRTVGFVPVHLYGHPADLPGIRRLCAERSLWLREDCAQAHGAAWQGRKVGDLRARGRFLVLPVQESHGDGGRGTARDR
jgi:UDP-N-acetyl-3-dehydro-alpha-D-glucosamine 3-aminotranferase